MTDVRDKCGSGKLVWVGVLCFGLPCISYYVSWHKMSVSLRCTAEINHDPDLLGAAPVSSFRRVIEVTGEGRMSYTSTSGRLPGK